MQQTFLKLALRKAARGTGSHATFLKERTMIQPLPNLTAILGSIPWVLVGGLAIRLYMPERMTLDVDILISADNEHFARQAFTAANYRILGELSIGRFSTQHGQQPPVDVLTTAEQWLLDAIHNPAHDESGHPVLPRPALITMKLHAGRTQDLADIQRMLATTPALERSLIRTQLLHQNVDLAEEFDALIQLADWEFGRDPSS